MTVAALTAIVAATVAAAVTAVIYTSGAPVTVSIHVFTSVYIYGRVS